MVKLRRASKERLACEFDLLYCESLESGSSINLKIAAI
jgi:hypothetical protein